jgi:hypothetical protein
MVINVRKKKCRYCGTEIYDDVTGVWHEFTSKDM